MDLEEIKEHKHGPKWNSEASDMLDMSILSKTVTKHYLCYPKDIEIIK